MASSQWGHTALCGTCACALHLRVDFSLLSKLALRQQQSVLHQQLELNQEFGVAGSGPLALLKQHPAPSGSHHSTAWHTQCHELHTCPLTRCPRWPHQSIRTKGRGHVLRGVYQHVVALLITVTKGLHDEPRQQRGNSHRFAYIDACQCPHSHVCARGCSSCRRVFGQGGQQNRSRPDWGGPS